MTDQGGKKSGAGPGRGEPRDRSGSRTSSRLAAPLPDDHVAAAPDGDDDERRQRPGQPTAAVRLVVLVTALGVLLISGAASLQIYFRQQRQIAELRTSIVERQQAIEDLDHQVKQWDDPAFVEQQARERFGWVMPGETGYRVIGPDGKPVEGATLDSTRADQETPASDAWWMKMWSSARTADRPLPGGTPVGTPIPSATPTPTPSGSATPTP